MSVKIAKSIIEGNSMMAICYNEEKTPIKTVHFGVEGYVDYIVPPHDADKKAR